MASSSFMVLYLAPTSGLAACYSVANPTVQQFHSVHSKVSTHHQSPIVATYHDIAVIFEKKNLKQLEQKKNELHLKLLENIFCEVFHSAGGGVPGTGYDTINNYMCHMDALWLVFSCQTLRQCPQCKFPTSCIFQSSPMIYR